MAVTRTLLVAGLILTIARGAQGLPIMSDMMQSTLPAERPSVGKGVVSADYSDLSRQGRALSLCELGCTYTPLSFWSIGAAYRDSDGHGSSQQTSYHAHGWEGWTSLRLLAERARRPDISLNAQVVHDNISLQDQSSSGDATASPRVTTQGVDLCAGKHFGSDLCQVDTGVYDVSIFGARQATLLALGVAYHHRFTRSVEGRVALAGYRDDYAGGVRHTYDLVAGVRAGRTDQPYLGLSVTYFPRGIPLAGTPLSTASMVNAFYSGITTGTLNTQQFGYVSIEAGIPF